MRSATLFVLTGLLAVVLAEGQFYVPRAYYTIDQEGHESLPVPLRRLRRSIQPSYYPGASASANANAEANAWGGGDANANAIANANARSNGYQPYPGLAPPTLGASYGSSRPLGYGQTFGQAGPISVGAEPPRSVSASSSVGLDSSGNGYYDQQTSVGGK